MRVSPESSNDVAMLARCFGGEIHNPTKLWWADLNQAIN
jgi:hypothetical protein